MESPKPRKPAGLGLAGARLWRDVTGSYTLRVDELLVLESACRTADTLALLEESLAGASMVVTGSMGQQREHPLLSEARQQRALLARLVHQLKLPDVGEVAGEAAGRRSTQARAAAISRWSKRGSA